jgi:hypothetical protein
MIMSKDLKISPKHGLNPSMMACPVCGKDTGVALCGYMRKDEKAPVRMLDLDPCKDCREELDRHAAEGFVIVLLDDSYSEGPFWPWFKSYVVVKHEAARKILSEGFGMSDELVDSHMGRGKISMPFKVGVKIGLVQQ